MRYKPAIVLAYFEECGLPKPELEYQFSPPRKWRFDVAWNHEFLIGDFQTRYRVPNRIALEVQGGIWTAGRHSRGAALLKEWEKLNTAAILGWRILYCQPKDLCTQITVDMIKKALV